MCVFVCVCVCVCRWDSWCSKRGHAPKLPAPKQHHLHARAAATAAAAAATAARTSSSYGSSSYSSSSSSYSSTICTREQQLRQQQLQQQQGERGERGRQQFCGRRGVVEQRVFASSHANSMLAFLCPFVVLSFILTVCEAYQC